MSETTGSTINCSNTTPTVTRIEIMDTIETYFRESTANHENPIRHTLFIIHSGKTQTAQMIPTTNARLCRMATLGKKKEKTAKKKSPGYEQKESSQPIMTKYVIQEPQV